MLTMKCEDALIDLVRLIQSLQEMEDAKWAEVSLGAISKSQEYYEAAAAVEQLTSLGMNLLRNRN